MTFQQVIQTVSTTTPDDWLIDDNRGIFTLMDDLNIRIHEVRGDTEQEPTPFHEDWAKAFSDKNPYRVEYELWYAASFVKLYHFVSVNGGRATIPYPKSAEELTITREQFAIANIVNFSGARSYFDRYIQRFTIE